ncbi:hypothetical protein ACRRTK_024999 [Alexandromys fortis]
MLGKRSCVRSRHGSPAPDRGRRMLGKRSCVRSRHGSPAPDRRRLRSSLVSQLMGYTEY